MKFGNYFKCDRSGKGYKLLFGKLTTFEERVLYLNGCRNHDNETDKKSQAQQQTGTSFAKSETMSSASRTKKRKVDGSGDDDNDEFTHKVESNSKRIKDRRIEANNPSQDDDTSVEELLFSNDLLLRAIFANLNVEDLKSCRLVNSLWNLEATKVLVKRDCLKAIEILNDAAIIHDSVKYRVLTELQDLRNTIANSKLFPSTYFAVAHDRLSENVVNFFRENGHLVKSFCFEQDDEVDIQHEQKGQAIFRADTGNVLLLVATSFPNLTTLKFVHEFNQTTPALILLGNEHLPDLKNLHTLEITSYSPADIVSVILKKANKLQNIYLHPGKNVDNSRNLDNLVKLKNFVSRLKNIQLEFSEETLQTYQKVLKQKPRFSSISGISVFCKTLSTQANVRQVLTALFQECSESLSEIVGLNDLQDIPGVNFPLLPNVVRLGIQLQSLLSGVNLAEAFPNLKIAEIENFYDELDEAIQESINPLLSVRQLQLKWGERCIPGIWVEKLCSFFPNLTLAKFCNPLEDSAYEFIWKLSKLQELHLEIGTAPKANLFSVLDSAFTGFSVKMAKTL